MSSIIRHHDRAPYVHIVHGQADMHSGAPSIFVAISFCSFRLANLPPPSGGCQHDKLMPAKRLRLAPELNRRFGDNLAALTFRRRLLEVFCNVSLSSSPFLHGRVQVSCSPRGCASPGSQIVIYEPLDRDGQLVSC